MQVPRSAVGKMGQCPSCGEKIPINRDTTSTTPQAKASITSATRKKWGSRAKPTVDAKQQFGRAVDLYCAGHYGEALAIFDALQAEFPDSAEIQRARRQCLDARNRDPLNLPGPADGQVAGDELDEGTVRAMRRIVVDKMLRGDSDAVQLQAAELVARMAGVLDATPARPAGGSGAAAAQGQEAASTPHNGESRAEPGGNGHVHDGSETGSGTASEVDRDRSAG